MKGALENFPAERDIRKQPALVEDKEGKNKSLEAMVAEITALLES